MSRSSFKSLIEENQIIIPLIQRDYAQGRQEEEYKARKFLEAVLDGMDSKNGLNLDFIYGSSFEENDKKFTPLDGQQRLTTLFLLYFYLSLKDDVIMNELSRFTYEVRSSSTDFIEELVNNRNSLALTDIRRNIENANWFFLSWNNDPTVKSILNMLELIEEIFSNSNFVDLEKITFDTLLLNEFNLTDELYVKMNSRGKPLSNFENFKSEFEMVIEKRFAEDHKEEFRFKSELDNEWLHIFWEISKHEPIKTDSNYFNFFTNLTLFFTLNDIKLLDDFDLFKYNYLDSDIDTIKIILDELMSYNDSNIHHIRNINIFENFLQPYIKGGRSGITYENRAIFYALMKFFINVGSIEENDIIFTSWMRINFNLINNVIFDNIDLFKNMIDIIDKLSDNIQDIYSHIGKIKLKNQSSQFTEEILKSELILKYPNENWEEELIIAEKHWYLDGEIGFLLNFSNNNIDKFIEYRDKLRLLFDKEKLDTNRNYQTLIHRALMAFEDDKDDLGYLKHTKHRKSNRYTFCVYDEGLRVKNENWRKVFNSQYFQNLLDIVGIDVEENLKDKIDSYSFDCDNFKSYFINPKKDWEVISYIRNYQIEYNNSKEIFLNKGGTAVDKWGWYRVAELYSYYLYKMDFEEKEFLPFAKVWYWDTSDGNPSIILDGYKNKYAIDIYLEDEFCIMFYNYKTNKIKSKNIIDVLVNNNFILDDKRFYLKNIEMCNIGKLFEIINQLCIDFNKILKEPKNDLGD